MIAYKENFNYRVISPPGGSFDCACADFRIGAEHRNGAARFSQAHNAGIGATR